MTGTNSHSPTTHFGGVDNSSLDTRNFDPSRDDIEGICSFFSIGKLLRFEKEKGITVSHSNFFVYVATAHGQYALKFYPSDAAKTIAVEYALNRLLISHLFPTPVMYAGKGGRPFITCKDRLATCYSFIDGVPAWQCIKQRDIYSKINTSMLSLKSILSLHKKGIPLQRQKNLHSITSTLARTSRSLAPYDQKKTIDVCLLEACRSYERHQPLFTRQCLHNNANLTNLLINKKNVYTLDLSHIREDYILSDLASLVISCFFFDIPLTTITSILKNYFNQHQLGPEFFPVLNTLVKIGLVKEYLKNIQREKSLEFTPYPTDIKPAFISHLKTRKKTIAAVLKKMDAFLPSPTKAQE